MFSFGSWVRFVPSVGFLFLARVMWVRGQRRRSLPLRWLSVATVAVALCAGLAAVVQLANLYASVLWLALLFAAWFLAVCAFVVAGVYGVREKLRGSGMQQ
jgi:hypothetical protein